MARTLLLATALVSMMSPAALTGCTDREVPPSEVSRSDPSPDSDAPPAGAPLETRASTATPDVLRSPDAEGSSAAPRSADRGARDLSPGAAAAASASTNPTVRIVFLGTSLTEGLGLEAPAEEAWPERIGEAFVDGGAAVEVVNAGVGGETSAGALRRLDWVLRQEPDVLVVETGANDGLRGLPVARLEANLDSLVARARADRPDMEIVIAGMEAPPNMGEAYVSEFRAVFSRVAERHQTALVPFLLEGVAGNAALNQPDGIHPTAEGHRRMARTAWPVLDSLLALRSRSTRPEDP